VTPSLAGGYDFLVPQRVVFGWGRRAEAGALARSLGRRAFIIHGSRTLERSGALEEIAAHLRGAGVEPVFAGGVEREPEVRDVDRASCALRERGAGSGDLVLGVGGGSALDLAKAACAMATSSESPTVKDYLEGVGKGLEIRSEPLPLIAMPTTAGTGSEATKNAVISSDAGASGEGVPFKKSLRSERMVPRIALIDPELTVSLPPATTAHTGMDAITQLIESYLSARARPLSSALAIHGLELAVPALPRAFRDGSDRGARECMAHAAFLSGMALANSGLGMAHGVAAALGIHCGIAHGLACAVMLPAALRTNREARPEETARLGEVICERRFSSREAAAAAASERIEELCATVGIPLRLGALGVRREDLPAIVRSSRGNSMSGNPRRLEDGELHALLEDLL
jgi:alcohol dehydrogenase class IV